MNKKDSKEIKPALFLLVIILSIFLKILLIKVKPLPSLQVTSQKVRLKIKKTSPLVIKCKIADCLSILVSFEKKQ
ncbi:MAG: hypothetical protein KKH20_12330, partial [Proteobacteria bacterium]|nr:hypothetical protein [Pseudomonadota bacterium]